VVSDHVHGSAGQRTMREDHDPTVYRHEVQHDANAEPRRHCQPEGRRTPGTRRSPSVYTAVWSSMGKT